MISKITVQYMVILINNNKRGDRMTTRHSVIFASYTNTSPLFSTSSAQTVFFFDNGCLLCSLESSTSTPLLEDIIDIERFPVNMKRLRIESCVINWDKKVQTFTCINMDTIPIAYASTCLDVVQGYIVR